MRSSALFGTGASYTEQISEVEGEDEDGDAEGEGVGGGVEAVEGGGVEGGGEEGEEEEGKKKRKKKKKGGGDKQKVIPVLPLYMWLLASSFFLFAVKRILLLS